MMTAARFLKSIFPTRRPVTLAALFLSVFLLVDSPAQLWFRAAAPAPTERAIRIVADGYAFSPDTIHANPGDTIHIEFVSRDVGHGLTIDGYPEIDLFAEPGRSSRVTFVAGKGGTYKLRCSVACGNLHPFMTGKLQVGPNRLLLGAGGLALLLALSGGWLALRPPRPDGDSAP
jgi:heme/copper-type cytochrome/quinol oxidase subunit 2